MDWWKEFPGWLITTALAFLAFAVVAWQEIRRRILLPTAHWEGTFVTAPIANGRGYEYFSLRNSGDIDAVDVMVLAYNCSIPGPNPGQILGIAEVMSPKRIDLESVNEESFLLINWRSPHHRARTLSTWLPVLEGTDLAAQHWKQRTWPWYRSWWARLRYRHNAGPGASLRAWIPRNPRKMARLAKKLNVPIPHTDRTR
jgi:hypothetical protein